MADINEDTKETNIVDVSDVNFAVPVIQQQPQKNGLTELLQVDHLDNKDTAFLSETTTNTNSWDTSGRSILSKEECCDEQNPHKDENKSRVEQIDGPYCCFYTPLCPQPNPCSGCDYNTDTIETGNQNNCCGDRDCDCGDQDCDCGDCNCDCGDCNCDCGDCNCDCGDCNCDADCGNCDCGNCTIL